MMIWLVNQNGSMHLVKKVIIEGDEVTKKFESKEDSTIN